MTIQSPAGDDDSDDDDDSLEDNVNASGGIYLGTRWTGGQSNLESSIEVMHGRALETL